MSRTTPSHVDRRAFMVASTVGFAGLQFGTPALAETVTQAAAKANRGGRAKSTILFFLCGGSSHVDMWDLKTEAPREYRGPFEPIATTAPGLQISEHLPFLAKQGHHLSVLRSVSGRVNTNDHHAGYYYNLTGHSADPSFLTLGNNRTPMPDDWPYMGTVVGSRRPAGQGLPNAITLPDMPSRKPYTRPGQFAGRLGVEHDPLYVYATAEQPLKFEAPALVLSGDVDLSRLTSRSELLRTVDGARREFDEAAGVRTWSQQQDRALSLLGSSRTTAAFQAADEPVKLRERYGQTVNGMSLLVARRLVEAGVPFITVFWNEKNESIAKKCKSGGGWDTHGNNFVCLKENLLPEFDQAFSALIEDLHGRDMLDETLLLVTSEMGRKPKIGDPRSGGVNSGLYGAGRDHWTHCLSVVMAGGGLQGGVAYGKSDRYGEYPSDRVITPAHVAKTVYHAMGINNLDATDKEGRKYNLLDEGHALTELF
ncbi:MAG: DUF1501 domain-containing protein [Planctomycetaceae bacterium]|nr:DUF1501 domain-containing protein [Planctomycetaceae bacterium]